MYRCELSDGFAAELMHQGHLQVLKRLMPDVPFEIMFDVPQAETELEIRDTLQS
jgi:hypothetical protein